MVSGARARATPTFITPVGRPRQPGFGPVNRVFPVNRVRARLTGDSVDRVWSPVNRAWSVDRVAVRSTGFGRLTGLWSG